MKTAGPYTQLDRAFTTTERTAQVRFILNTTIHRPYTEGHVTYDDAELGLER